MAGKTLTFNKSLTLEGTDSTTMTFPSTSATIARTDAANTFTGHQTVEGVTSTGATGTGKFVFDTGPTLSAPVLGTPGSGTLTNCTGLPVAGITASTSTALGVGSIELGNASDTTLSRSAAGKLAVEGLVVLAGTFDRDAGTSTSGTATTQVAQIAAAAGNKLVAWTLTAAQLNAANNQVKIIITYSDSTTDSVTGAGSTSISYWGNAGGLIASNNFTLTTLQNKDVTTIRIETAGIGTSTRAGIISAIEIKQ